MFLLNQVVAQCLSVPSHPSPPLPPTLHGHLLVKWELSMLMLFKSGHCGPTTIGARYSTAFVILRLSRVKTEGPSSGN